MLRPLICAITTPLLAVFIFVAEPEFATAAAGLCQSLQYSCNHGCAHFVDSDDYAECLGVCKEERAICDGVMAALKSLTGSNISYPGDPIRGLRTPPPAGLLEGGSGFGPQGPAPTGGGRRGPPSGGVLQ